MIPFPKSWLLSIYWHTPDCTPFIFLSTVINQVFPECLLHGQCGTRCSQGKRGGLRLAFPFSFSFLIFLPLCRGPFSFLRPLTVFTFLGLSPQLSVPPPNFFQLLPQPMFSKKQNLKKNTVLLFIATLITKEQYSRRS